METKKKIEIVLKSMTKLTLTHIVDFKRFPDRIAVATTCETITIPVENISYMIESNSEESNVVVSPNFVYPTFGGCV